VPKILLNTVVLSPRTVMYAGMLVEPADYSTLVAAGGVLAATGDAYLDAASFIARAQWAAGDRTPSDVEMAEAVRLSAYAATGAPPTPLEALRSSRVGEAVDIAVGWTAPAGVESRAVRVQGAGLLKVDYVDGGAGVEVPVAAGIPHAMAIVKIYSTGDGSTVTGKVVVER
jgi:hypothetical protein